jgi:hypothetical protein
MAELDREKALRTRRGRCQAFLLDLATVVSVAARGRPHMGGSDSSYSCFDNVVTTSSNFDCYPDTPMQRHRVIFSFLNPRTADNVNVVAFHERFGVAGQRRRQG